MRTRMVMIIALAVSLALVGQRVSPGQGAAKKGYLTKTYDILDLTIPVLNRPGEEIISFVHQTQSEDTPALCFFSGDEIVELIRGDFGDGKDWEPPADIAFQETTGFLVVRNTPEIVQKAEKILDYLRNLKKLSLVTIEATMVIIETSLLEDIKDKNPSVILDDAVVETILAKGQIFKVAELTAYSGQRSHIRKTRAVTYVRDYDIVQSSGETGRSGADPVVDIIQEGILFDVTPFLGLGQDIRLDLRLTVTELIRPMEKFDPKISIMGKIDQPELEITEMRTSLKVPAGKTVLAGGITMKADPTKSVIALVTPTIETGHKSIDAFPVREGAFHLKIINLGNIIAPYPMFGSRLKSVFHSGFVGSEPSESSLAMEGAIHLIQYTIASETWEGMANEMEGVSIEHLGSWSNYLALVHQPKVIKQVEALINDLIKAEKMVTVETRFLRLGNAYWQELRRDKRKGNFIILSPKKIREILSEVRKGEKAQLLSRTEVTGFNRQQFTIGHGSVKNYLRDIEVIASKKALAGEPVMGSVGSGLFLETRPILSKEGQYIDLFIQTGYQELTALEPTEVYDEALGRLQKPHLDSQGFTGNVLLPIDGGGILTGITTSGKDEKGQPVHTAILIRAKVVK